MAKFEVTGLDVQIKQLQHIADKTTGFVKVALYDGAAIVANEIRSGMNVALSELPWNEERRSGDLERSLYIAKMQTEDGYTFTEIGFAGYGSDGVANALKANVLESGRSDQYRPGTGFVRKAVRRAKPLAQEAMAKSFDKQIEKILKEK